MVGLLKSHRVRMFSMSVFAIVLPSIVLCSIQEGINSRACIFSNIFIILFSKGKARKIYFQFLSDCTCKDLINPSGYGNCASTGFSSKFCYVNQPTSCSDALDSLDLPGEKFSSEPCKGRKSHFILTKLNVSSVEVFYVILSKISNIFRTKYFLN